MIPDISISSPQFFLCLFFCPPSLVGEHRGRRSSHLHDLPGLHGQRGEVPAAVDRDALAQDGVQPLHLIPRQHTEPPALIGGITVGGRHDDSVGCPRGGKASERRVRFGPPDSLFSDGDG